MYHILSHSDLYSALLFYFFFFFTSFRILQRGARSPQGPIFPIPNSTRMRYSEFYQRFFPTYLLDLCISGDRLDLSSYSYTLVSSSLCHSFYHFCQKCEIYTLKPFCIQADIPFHPAYKNSQIIRPKLSIKEEFITNRTGMPCLLQYLLISFSQYVSSSSFLSHSFYPFLTTWIPDICPGLPTGKNTRLHLQVPVPSGVICHYSSHLESVGDLSCIPYTEK